MMLVGILSATGCTKKPGPDKPSPVPVDLPWSGVDLKGYEFIVADSTKTRWEPAEGSSDIANAVLKRVEQVERDLNCTITRIDYNEEEFINAVNAGDKYADMIICPTFSVGENLEGARILDLNAIKNLDLNDERWAKYNKQNLVTFDNMCFGAYAAFASMNDEVYMIYYNRSVIKELGLEDPQSLCAKGEWNIDKFLEYCRLAKKDLNGDGVFDVNDRYGFTCGHFWDVAHVMYLATGNMFYYEPVFGEILCAYLEDGYYEKAVAAINQIKEICTPYENFWKMNPGEDYSVMTDAFAEGKALFYTYTRGRHVADPIYEMKDDFGLVPMPNGGPEDDDFHCWTSWDSPMVCIPITNPDPETSAIVIEALNYYSQEENEIDLNEFKNTKLRSESDYEMAEKMVKYACVDMGFLSRRFINLGFEAATDIPRIVCCYSREKEAVSEIEKILKQVQQGIDIYYDVLDDFTDKMKEAEINRKECPYNIFNK